MGGFESYIKLKKSPCSVICRFMSLNSLNLTTVVQRKDAYLRSPKMPKFLTGRIGRHDVNLERENVSVLLYCIY